MIELQPSLWGGGGVITTGGGGAAALAIAVPTMAPRANPAMAAPAPFR